MTKKKVIGNLIVLAVLLLVIGGIWFKTQMKTDTWSKTVADKTVVVGLDDTFVPMGFRDKDGKLVGFDVDLARDTFKALGLKVKFQPIDWSMKETELKTGHIDMIWNGYTITPDRAKKVAFSNPYHSDSQVLITMASSHIDSAEAMKGQIVGLQTGSSGMSAYNDDRKVLKQYVKSSVQYDTFDKALNDLQVGRVQGVLIDSDFARYYVAHEKDPEAYKIVKLGYKPEKFAVGFRKGDVTLRTKVNAELAKLQANGTINKISEKYFGTPNEK